ncbi:melanocortin receptor 5-like [Clytia hemisphaerica]|uniref:melanocortin receptor 5-like n=1 Tax=Clytia hemisphaerica TaxID=252671 RepID=UPI0034D75343|eukprot:TCONS_00024452-protein
MGDQCFPGVHPPFELSMLTTILSGVIALMTIIGNGLIIITVIKDPLKRLHTPFNYFLVNLAVADLIVGCSTMPVSVYFHYQESTGFIDLRVSKVLQSSIFISGSASILSLLALSVDRYFCIVWAIRYRQCLNWNRCHIITACIWIFSLSFPFLSWKLGYVKYLMFFACSSVLVGIILMLFVYAKVHLYLQNQTKQLRKRTTSKVDQTTNPRRLSMKRKVTQTFLIIMLAFVLVYVPAFVMIFTLQFCESCGCVFRHWLRDLQFLLVASNSAINPLICTARLKQFRTSIKQLFTGKRARNSASKAGLTNLASRQMSNETTTTSNM